MCFAICDEGDVYYPFYYKGGKIVVSTENEDVLNLQEVNDRNQTFCE
jgi:hypothetical protein